MSFPMIGALSNLGVPQVRAELITDQTSGISNQPALISAQDLILKTNLVANSIVNRISEDKTSIEGLLSSTKKPIEQENSEQIIVGAKRKARITEKKSVDADNVDNESSNIEVGSAQKKEMPSKCKSKKQQNTIAFGNQTLELGELLGKGAFGSVFEAQANAAGYMVDQGSFAVKVNTKKIKTEQESIKKEASVLKHLDENGAKEWFIVSLLGESQKGKSSYLVFPKYIMNLRTESSRSNPNLERTALLADQLFSALYFLEQSTPSIIHCDIKPENIFVENLEPLKIRLGDFGSCIESPCENANKKYIVTRWYRPPEVVFSFPLTTAVDMWSAGCVIYEYQTKRNLFRSENESNLVHNIYNLLGPFSREYFNQIRIPQIAEGVVRYSQSEQQSASGEHQPMLLSNLDRTVFFKRPAESSSSEQNDYEQSCVGLFKQMLSSIFYWDARHRLTAGVAKFHPFILKIFSREDLLDVAGFDYSFDDEDL